MMEDSWKTLPMLHVQLSAVVAIIMMETILIIGNAFLLSYT
jgi:hypothetical protein